MSMMVNGNLNQDLRFAKTRIDIYRSSNRSPSDNNMGKTSRSTSRDYRPFT